MKNKAFALGTAVFLLTVFVDLYTFFNGLEVMGVFLFVGTILVFGVGIIWVIYQNDQTLHVRKPWLLVPFVLFGAGAGKALRESSLVFMNTPENLREVGQLLMSRYQIALWLVSLILLFIFAAAASLLVRRRA